MSSQPRSVFALDESDDRIVVSIPGDSVTARYADIHLETNAAVTTVLKARPKAVLIDLGTAAMLNSICIGSLIKIARQGDTLGADVSFCGGTPAVLDVLRTMNIFTRWPHTESASLTAPQNISSTSSPEP